MGFTPVKEEPGCMVLHSSDPPAREAGAIEADSTAGIFSDQAGQSLDRKSWDGYGCAQQESSPSRTLSYHWCKNSGRVQDTRSRIWEYWTAYRTACRIGTGVHCIRMIWWLLKPPWLHQFLTPTIPVVNSTITISRTVCPVTKTTTAEAIRRQSRSRNNHPISLTLDRDYNKTIYTNSS